MSPELLTVFGPVYPDLGQKVARLRRGTDRQAHGQAVLDAIRSKQRGELRRETPTHAVVCASGTSHVTGEAILKAIAAKHHAAILNAPAQERRARKPEQWLEMYEMAMREPSRCGATGRLSFTHSSARVPAGPRYVFPAGLTLRAIEQVWLLLG